ncbi:MAG: mechanosensitive ion channel domain-containing protein [Pseudomonadota bacterium]
MKNSTSSAPNSFSFDLPELSLQVISFLQIGIYVLLALIVYYFSRRLVQVMSNTGALEKRTFYFQFLNVATFVLPGLIFLYGLTSVSQDSLFVSLVFFVIVSIVFGFALVDPARSLFASILINLRGDVRVGDFISINGIEGEIVMIGAFNLRILSKSGARIFVPTHQVLRNPYEIHAKKGGPSIVLSLPADKISKKNLERLAHLCPFKRKGSDIRISTVDTSHKLSIEIVNREARPWVYRYFENHFQ